MVDIHTQMMQLALEQAKKAAQQGEVPVGAVVYDCEGTILAAAHNEVEMRQDPTAHAEFIACQKAAKQKGDMYLTDCTVAITLEPCAMCAQALSWFRVKEIRFGAYDVKSGGTENGARVLAHAHHKPMVIGGILEEECKLVLQQFFKEKRK
ncbi:MAG: nucleoside deaminase [Alphaproteobacteria bacterium]|nr:nucleoside deaminase [Alphaproteobacteria bacterium]MDD9920473.1 nucleoside deaminase [Alphaproteobacteria bacterium]